MTDEQPVAHPGAQVTGGGVEIDPYVSLFLTYLYTPESSYKNFPWTFLINVLEEMHRVT